MKFTCPHCHTASKINQPKAGRFKPNCPTCNHSFILIIDNAGKVSCQLPPPTANPEDQSAAAAKNDPGTLPSSREEQNADRSAVRKPSSPSEGETSNSGDGSHSPVEVSQEWESVAYETESLSGEDVGEQNTMAQNMGNTTTRLSHHETEVAGDGEEPLHQAETATLSSRTSITPPTKNARESFTEANIPNRLGGYKLDHQLGKGGMGTVFLGTQLSLDRQVAIKILKPDLTDNPLFVSRFVREAYAAAQLVHHNVVQIYDIGSQDKIHFYSMELVKGDSLDRVLKHQRRMDCDTAAGYILQAARGLKFAHDQGMVHRDVKPANLMLDEHGIVKVADLGLVKIGDEAADENVADQLGASTSRRPSDSQITQVGVSVGTPAYMSPEQWKQSSNVDHRADIYSLGCSFYVMVTGKLPFEGKTPREVVTKVISEPAVPPELLVKDIPKRISTIVNKMIAKDPDDRYADMGLLISDLEEYLGVSSSGAFSPSERDVGILEKSINAFNNNPLVKLRKNIVRGGLGLMLLLFLAGIFFSPRFAMAVIGTTISAGASYFVIRGLFEKTHLFNRARDYLFSNQIGDWFTLAISGVVAIVLSVFVLGMTGSLVTLILGPILGIGIYFGLDKTLAAKRKPAIAEGEKLLKELRLRGQNEDLLRQFVCRFSGDDWEEFFEELFGYPAKLNARNWLKGETGKSRKSFRMWRDPLIRWIDRRFEERDKVRQIRHLEKVEVQKLIAQGVEKADARLRAKNIARLMTENAEAWKQSQIQIQSNKTSVQGKTVADKVQKTRPTLSNLSRNLDEKLISQGPKATFADRFHMTVSCFIGPRTRFLTGVILFGLCLWWMQANGKVNALSHANFAEAVKIVFSQEAYDDEGAVSEVQPIPLPLVPDALTALFNSVNHGVIGLVFIFSATVWGWLVTVPVVLGGVVALLGTSVGMIPEDGFYVLSQENIALIAGCTLAIVGCYFLKPNTLEPL